MDKKIAGSQGQGARPVNPVSPHPTPRAKPDFKDEAHKTSTYMEKTGRHLLFKASAVSTQPDRWSSRG